MGYPLETVINLFHFWQGSDGPKTEEQRAINNIIGWRWQNVIGNNTGTIHFFQFSDLTDIQEIPDMIKKKFEEDWFAFYHRGPHYYGEVFVNGKSHTIVRDADHLLEIGEFVGKLFFNPPHERSN